MRGGARGHQLGSPRGKRVRERVFQQDRAVCRQQDGGVLLCGRGRRRRQSGFPLRAEPRDGAERRGDSSRNAGARGQACRCRTCGCRHRKAGTAARRSGKTGSLAGTAGDSESAERNRDEPAAAEARCIIEQARAGRGGRAARRTAQQRTAQPCCRIATARAGDRGRGAAGIARRHDRLGADLAVARYKIRAARRCRQTARSGQTGRSRSGQRRPVLSCGGEAA